MSTQHKIHLYRTQVEYIYIVSVTCQIWQLGTLIYKKDNYVTVLTHYGIAINASWSRNIALKQHHGLMIYLSYVNLTIQMSQFDEYPT